MHKTLSILTLRRCNQNDLTQTGNAAALNRIKPCLRETAENLRASRFDLRPDVAGKNGQWKCRLSWQCVKTPPGEGGSRILRLAGHQASNKGSSGVQNARLRITIGSYSKVGSCWSLARAICQLLTALQQREFASI